MFSVFGFIGYLIYQVFHLLFHGVALAFLGFTEILVRAGQLIDYISRTMFNAVHWIFFAGPNELDIHLH